MSSSYGASGSQMDLGMEESEEAVEEMATSTALEGLLISIFQNLGFGTGLVTYISSAVASISGIINRSGVQILIFLAALQSISPAIYESCQIDGATSWETFWKITFPMISPMILVNGVYTIIDSFTTASNPAMSYISQVYKLQDVLSSAMAWIYFIIVILIVAVIAAILSAFVFYQRKND